MSHALLNEYRERSARALGAIEQDAADAWLLSTLASQQVRVEQQLEAVLALETPDFLESPPWFTNEEAGAWADGYSSALNAVRKVTEQTAQTLSEAGFDAKIGRLVRLKLTSGNEVPVERCLITAKELAALKTNEVES